MSKSVKQVIEKPPESIKPNPQNPRTHPPEQIDAIVASIKQFGFLNPILVDKSGMIIAGHGRLEAAIKMGLATVPTMSAEHLTKKQVKAYTIADNQIAAKSEWDEYLLRLSIDELTEAGFDADALFGWDKDFQKLFATPEPESPPTGFGQVDPNMPTNHTCPKCGYEWNGASEQKE